MHLHTKPDHFRFIQSTTSPPFTQNILHQFDHSNICMKSDLCSIFAPFLYILVKDWGIGLKYATSILSDHILSHSCKPWAISPSSSGTATKLLHFWFTLSNSSFLPGNQYIRVPYTQLAMQFSCLIFELCCPCVMSYLYLVILYS